MSNQKYPKIAIFDLTAIGDYSATGQIKRNLFADWPQENILGISGANGNNVKILKNKKRVNFPLEDAFAEISLFNPDLIFYRPVPENQALHDFSMQIIKTLDRPLVTWIVDDWPSSLKENDSALFSKMDKDFRYLLSKSIWNYSISASMSENFRRRYGVDFSPLANGVVPAEWALVSKLPLENRAFKIRYAGGLAENMNRASFIRLANSVEALSKDIDVTLELLTKPHWWDKVKDQVGHFKSLTVYLKSLRPSAYRNWLKHADCVVILYNFDDISIKYVANSFANKLPECLASGSFLLMHGPSEVATIAYMENQDCAVIVNQPSEDKLKAAIAKLVKDEKEQKHLIENARSLAFEKHNLNITRDRLYSKLKSLSLKSQNIFSFKSFDRQDAAKLDETNIIFELSTHMGPKTMIDVGGHSGGSSREFAKKKWNIFAFEPDPDNRKLFAKNLGHMKNVVLDPRAVGKHAEKNVAFYASPESTGISGMLAFRDTHKQVTTVDVTTVDQIIKDNNLTKIDFLKIDAEGYDFSVLKGVPWDRLHPNIIECEFEDFKTLQLGHTWRDICNYLMLRGYTVYISEWHPVVRYGVPHNWHTMRKYPCELNGEKVWGNILAFKQDPGEKALSEAVDKVLQFTSHRVEPTLGAEVEKSNMSGISTNSNSSHSFGERLRLKSPVLFRVAQFGKWSLGFLRRHIILSLTAILLIAFCLLSPFFVARLAAYKWILWSVSLAVALGVLAMIGIAFVNMMAQRIAIRQSAARAQLRAEILRDMQKLHADTESFQEQIVGKLDAKINKSNKNRQRSNDRLSKRIKQNNQIAKNRNQRLEAKLHQVEAEKTQLETSLETLKAEINELNRSRKSSEITQANEMQKFALKLVGQIEAVNANLNLTQKTSSEEMKKIVAELSGRLDTESKRNSTSFARSIEQLEERLESLKTNSTVNANETKALNVTLEKSLAEIIADVEQLKELKTTTNKIKERIDQTAVSMLKNSNQISEFNRNINSLDRKLSRTKRAVAAEQAKKSISYHHFNRVLKAEHVNQLTKNWLGPLNLKETKKSLAYAAERINITEKNLKGRLATSLENALLRTLVAKAVRGKKLRVLEVGVLFGTGLAIIHEIASENFESVHYTAIDPLEGYYGNDKPDLITQARVNRSNLLQNMELAKISPDQFTLLEGFSTDEDIVQAASKNLYDLLVIDGDHSYAGVKADFVNFAPLVKRGGYIIVDDDSVPEWPEITRYVDEELLPRQDIALVGRLWRSAVFRVIKKVKI